MIARVIATLIVALAVAAACGSPPATSPAPAATSGESAGGTAWFEEEAAARGIAFVHRSGHESRHLLPEIMGGGGALLDMDGDGDLDLLLVQSGSLAARDRPAGHRLYRNDGRGRFEDVSASHGVAAIAGYGMGAAAADYDADGDVDLYITGLGANTLLQNDGAGRFTDVTAPARVAGSGWSTSAAFADLDTDGDLDLFVTRYLAWTPAIERECYSLTGVVDYCSPKNYDAPTSSLLFRNDGNGTFTDVSKAAGLTAAVGNGLGVLVEDVDADGRPDVFVANDGTPNHLWLNRGSGRLAESAVTWGVAIDQDGAPKAGMGVHAADVDDDGDNDLIVMNLDGESDSFFRHDGRFFVDATSQAGLRVASRRFTRFGVAFMDFDNDGRLDLFEANGRVGLQAETFDADPYAEPSLLLAGTGGGRFEEVRPRGGTRAPLVATSRAAIVGDLDTDGGVDVIVVNRDRAPHLLRNVVPSRGHWLMARAIDGRGRDAVGASLTVTAGALALRRDVRTAYSYLAAHDPRVHVGLGASRHIDAIVVRWPDGTRERFGPFEADRLVELRQGRGARVQ